MTDTPTPERVGELLEEWRADKAAGGYEANSYDLAQHLADEYGPLAESWQRQRAELDLVKRDERAKGVKRVVYPDADPCELDKQGGHYVRHLEAMTKEGLHHKFEIAEQLGARDLTIQRQRAEIEALTALVRGAKWPNSNYGTPILPECPWCGSLWAEGHRASCKAATYLRARLAATGETDA